MRQYANYRKRLAKCNELIAAACGSHDFWYSGANKDFVLQSEDCPGLDMLDLLQTEIRREMKHEGKFLSN